MIFFFFNDTATTEIYTLSLHDALPISVRRRARGEGGAVERARVGDRHLDRRSEEHTSELQSPCNLVCRLLLEKKKTSRYSTSPALMRAHNTRRSTRSDRYSCEHTSTAR